MRSELERLTLDWVQVSGTTPTCCAAAGWLSLTRGRDLTQDLGPLEHAFLAASRALAVRDQVQLRRSVRRLRLAVTGLVGFLVVALIGTFAVFQANRRNQAQSRVALARQLGADAGSIALNEPDTAILLGLQALSAAHADADRPPPSAGLISGLAELSHESTLLTAHPTRCMPSPTATTAGSRSPGAGTGPFGSGTRARTRRLVPRSSRPPPVNALAISPDSRLVATGGQDGIVRLWDTATRQPVGTPVNVDGSYLYSVAFSPDGRLIAAGSDVGTVRVWDVATGRPRSAGRSPSSALR